MEDTGENLELVHVLRHSFRPSEQLEQALENFLPPGSERPRSFLPIKSLGMIALDGVSHARYAYSERLIAARRMFEDSKGQSMPIIPDIEVRQVGEKTLRVLLGLENKLRLYHLLHTTKMLLPDGLPLRDPGGKEFSVFAQINSSVPISKEFKDEATEKFNETYKSIGRKHLLNVLPEGIVGIDQFRAIPVLYREQQGQEIERQVS